MHACRHLLDHMYVLPVKKRVKLELASLRKFYYFNILFISNEEEAETMISPVLFSDPPQNTLLLQVAIVLSTSKCHHCRICPYMVTEGAQMAV